MYAIIDIAGQQFKAEQGKSLFVHRLEAAEGSTIELDKVILVSDEGGAKLTGLDKIKVKATVVSHVKGDKVIVFKKKRRKGYKKKNGHRQALTQIMIDEIGGVSAKTTAKKASKPRKKKETETSGEVTE